MTRLTATFLFCDAFNIVVYIYEHPLKSAQLCTYELRNACTHGLIPGGPKKTSRTLRNYNGTYTLRGKISFGTFVDQYALLLTYKFQ